MQYRTVKKNGDKLSVLGFGGMRFPENNGKIDELRATRQLKQAIDKGVNYVDTAYIYHYGKSESFIGKALSDGYRAKVKLATKLPVWFVKSREDMDRFLNTQLKNLKTDYIDYYLLHALNGKSWNQMKKLGVFDFINSAKEEGKILNIGFSFHGLKDDFKRIIDEYEKWVFCQIQYNYLDEKHQAGRYGLEYAASKDIAVFIMEPLRGGMLVSNIPEPVQKVFDESGFKGSPAYWALRWVLNRSDVTMVLSGMNNEKHIEENISTAIETIPDSMSDVELEFVSRLEKAFRNYLKVSCNGCGYCMPCPHGVNIPTCLEVYNGYVPGNKIAALSKYIGRVYNLSDGTSSGAFLCKKCGLCEEKCPQDIEIQRHLMDIKKIFEPFYLRIVASIVLFILKYKFVFKSKK